MASRSLSPTLATRLAMPLGMLGMVAALLVALSTGSARAAAPCVEPVIVADAEVTKRWPSAEGVVRTRVAELDDLDRCARVDLVAGGQQIVVVVTLGDGRSAVRRADRVEDLPEIVEALLVLPPVAPALPPHDPPAEVAKPKKAPPAPIVATAPAPAPPPPARNHGFEIGVGGAERAAGASLHVGLGVAMHAHLTYGAWHVGIGARADAINAPTHNAAGDSILVRSTALAVNVGRRFHAGAFDVDLLGGAALVAQEQDTRDDAHVEALTPRWTTVVRVSQSATNVRPFIAADVELGPPNRRRAPPLPFVPWPSWSVGFTFGVLWVG